MFSCEFQFFMTSCENQESIAITLFQDKEIYIYFSYLKKKIRVLPTGVELKFDSWSENSDFRIRSKPVSFRTVPTFVTAHTFCASRDTRVSYGWWLLIQDYFARFKTMRRKQNVASALVIQKENSR